MKAFDWRAPRKLPRQLGVPVLCAGVFGVARKTSLYTLFAGRVAASHGPGVSRNRGSHGQGKTADRLTKRVMMATE